MCVMGEGRGVPLPISLCAWCIVHMLTSTLYLWNALVLSVVFMN